MTVRGAVPQWLSRQGGVHELELGPLSVGAIHELLRGRLDTDFPRPVLLRIWETSGGNPFFALELARALERRGGRIEAGGELPVPETLEDLVADEAPGAEPGSGRGLPRRRGAQRKRRSSSSSSRSSMPTPASTPLCRLASSSSTGSAYASRTRCWRPPSPRGRWVSVGARSTAGSRASRRIPRSRRVTWHWQPRRRAHRWPRRSTPRRGMLAPAGRRRRRPSSQSRRVALTPSSDDEGRSAGGSTRPTCTSRPGPRASADLCPGGERGGASRPGPRRGAASARVDFGPRQAERPSGRALARGARRSRG